MEIANIIYLTKHSYTPIAFGNIPIIGDTIEYYIPTMYYYTLDSIPAVKDPKTGKYYLCKIIKEIKDDIYIDQHMYIWHMRHMKGSVLYKFNVSYPEKSQNVYMNPKYEYCCKNEYTQILVYKGYSNDFIVELKSINVIDNDFIAKVLNNYLIPDINNIIISYLDFM